MTTAGPLLLTLGLALCLVAPVRSESTLHAGAAKVDITPRDLPVIRNGGFLEATTDKVLDPLHSRCVVLHDTMSDTRVAIAVVDSCMIPRSLCDAIKKDVTARTGIPGDHILISATHCHSAPSVMHYCLGTRADPAYTKALPPLVVDSIAKAAAALQPARAGWTRFDADDFTKTRRWVTRPDKMLVDPFGKRTVRAMMHPGHQNPDWIGESGPADPWFSLLSIQSEQGKPLALLGNFSMHYFSGHPGISADYFGLFANKIAEKLAPGDPAFIGILSQGTSGDSWRGDYSKPAAANNVTMDKYSSDLVALASSAAGRIEHHQSLPLAMAESRLTFRRRTPDEARLAWARPMVEAMAGRRPRTRPEVYAEQALYIHDNPEEEIVLQAIRLGDLGLTAIPNEVYALTGLKLKARSPLGSTINFSLANGAAGYIPPPEQHHLGGYTTWPSRTAGLEVEAEPKIAEEVLKLLERASGKKRRAYSEPSGTYVDTIRAQKPLIHERLADLESGGRFEPGVAFHLPGVTGPGFPGLHETRSAHFAGGRLPLQAPGLGDTYSASLWIWNGMPAEIRPVTGYFLSRGEDGAAEVPGDHLGIGGTHSAAGKLILFNGNGRDELLAGKTLLPLREWTHVVLVREKDEASLYLNGKLDTAGTLPATHAGSTRLFVGGRTDNFANFEGRLDEVAVFNRALTAEEVAAQFKASGLGKD